MLTQEQKNLLLKNFDNFSCYGIRCSDCPLRKKDECIIAQLYNKILNVKIQKVCKECGRPLEVEQ